MIIFLILADVGVKSIDDFDWSRTVFATKLYKRKKIAMENKKDKRVC